MSNSHTVYLTSTGSPLALKRHPSWECQLVMKAQMTDGDSFLQIEWILSDQKMELFKEEMVWKNKNKTGTRTPQKPSLDLTPKEEPFSSFSHTRMPTPLLDFSCRNIEILSCQNKSDRVHKKSPLLKVVSHQDKDSV